MVEYTIDDIRGPTVAREMAQLKEFVLAKFNGAIADAEAAAAAAATAAAQAVLDSLDSRVGALEGDMTTAQGDIVTNANAILTLDGSVVKLGGVQTITDVKNVPLEATGTASNQIASSQKVKNELDNYAPMVRNTGNMIIDGDKTFNNLIGGRFKKQFTSFGSNDWTLLYKRDNSGRAQHLIGYASQSFIFALISSDSVAYTRVFTTTSRPYTQPIIKITKDSNGVVCVWCRGLYSATINWHLLENAQYSTEYVTGITPVNNTYAMPVVDAVTGYDPDATYIEVHDSEDFAFIR